MSSEKTRGGGTFIPASDTVSGFYVEVTWNKWKWLGSDWGMCVGWNTFFQWP